MVEIRTSEGLVMHLTEGEADEFLMNVNNDFMLTDYSLKTCKL